MASLISQNQHQTNLTVADDDMEISSERGAADDQIDIDIDLEGYPHHAGDDEIMVEDDVAIRDNQNPSRDDLMMDGDAAGHDAEDGMIEDQHALGDEDLYDANTADQDIDLLDDVQVSRLRESSALPDVTITEDLTALNSFPEEPTVQQASASTNDRSGDGEDPGITLENLAADSHPAIDGTEPEESHAPHDENDLLRNSSEANDGAEFDLTHEPTANVDFDHLPEPQETTFEVKAGSAVEGTFEPENQGGEEVVDEPSSASQHDQSELESQHLEVAPLHPVMISYDGEQFELFASSAHDTTTTYLLEDISLAHNILKDLLCACKHILLGHVDDSVELELDVPALGLFVAEDSKHALNLSLAEILDVYLQLCWNDGIDVPEPLSFSITIRNTFEDRMKHLREAASSGTGLSQLSVTDESDESYHNDEEQPAEHQTLDHSHAEDEDVEEQGNVVVDNESAEDGDGSEDIDGRQTSHAESGLQNQNDKTHDSFEEEEDEVEENESFEQEAQGQEVNAEIEAEHADDAEDEIIDYEEVGDENDELSGSSTVQGDRDEQQDDPAYNDAIADAETLNDQEHEEEQNFEQDFAEDVITLDEQEGNADAKEEESNLEAPSQSAPDEFSGEDPDQGANFPEADAYDAEDQISAFEQEISVDAQEKPDFSGADQLPEESATEALDAYDEEEWEGDDAQVDINDFYPEDDEHLQEHTTDAFGDSNAGVDAEAPGDETSSNQKHVKDTPVSVSRKRSWTEHEQGEENGGEAKKARST